jgi:hypothetical protein
MCDRNTFEGVLCPHSAVERQELLPEILDAQAK